MFGYLWRTYLNGESDGARVGMGGDVHGVETGVKHTVWHQDVATATVLLEFPVIQVHRLVCGMRGKKGHTSRPSYFNSHASIPQFRTTTYSIPIPPVYIPTPYIPYLKPCTPISPVSIPPVPIPVHPNPVPHTSSPNTCTSKPRTPIPPVW